MKKIIYTVLLSFIGFYSCQKPSDNVEIPSLTTSGVSSITSFTAISGGSISSDGGSPINSRGVVWDLNHNPTISLSTKTSDGTGIGSFTSNISNLSPNTTYYVRAYITNANGTTYGNEITFMTLSIQGYSFVQGSPVTEIDGNTYPTIITSCGQTWMQKNLTAGHYRNGNAIANITSSPLWSILTTPAWCWYKNDSIAYSAYGRLYNWFAATDIRGIAPVGWHIPTNSDWKKLIKCIDPNADTSCQSCITSYSAGGAMKESGLLHWANPNVVTTLRSGFNALPGGYRYAGMSIDFTDITAFGYWWSTSEYSPTNASNFQLFNYDSIVVQNNYSKYLGYSVRCVKD